MPRQVPQPSAPAQRALAAECDELGALEKKLLPFRADLDRIEALRKVIRAHYAGEDAKARFQPSGEAFFCTVGPRGNERTINYPKLIKRIGLKAFAVIATVTLKALEAATSPAVVADVVTEQQIGPRTIHTFEKYPAVSL